jgi:hypothetical protein
VQRDFQITNAIYLTQPPHKLDLHNAFDFCSLQYSVKDRILLLRWQRSDGNWVAPNTPASVSVKFEKVSEFRFHPREAHLPFTEDDCVDVFGYWTDEAWAKGDIVLEGDQAANPSWLTAIRFMSDAVIIVQAASAQALIDA